MVSYSDRWLPLLEKLDAGELVVTASNRQADFLRNQYRYFKTHQLSSNKTKDKDSPPVWYQPKILTDNQWLRELFQGLMLRDDKTMGDWSLLSDQESRHIWEQVIEGLEVDGDEDENDQEANYLLDTNRTAERVRQAADRLEQWQLSETIASSDSYSWRKETSRFQSWHRQFSEKCLKNHWLEHYQLDNWLAVHLNTLANTLTNNLSQPISPDFLPIKLHFLGFQEFTPARLELLNRLKKVGCEVETITANNIETQSYRYEFSDIAEEIIETALWAKQLWIENPEQRIGIVIPNLNQDRELTKRTFERVFCASELLKSDDQIIRPFDISLGLPLSSYHQIDTGLSLLSFLSRDLQQEELLLLLQSPHISTKDQQPHIIELSRLIRKSRQTKISLKDLVLQLLASDDYQYHTPSFYRN